LQPDFVRATLNWGNGGATPFELCETTVYAAVLHNVSCFSGGRGAELFCLWTPVPDCKVLALGGINFLYKNSCNYENRHKIPQFVKNSACTNFFESKITYISDSTKTLPDRRTPSLAKISSICTFLVNAYKILFVRSGLALGGISVQWDGHFLPTLSYNVVLNCIIGKHVKQKININFLSASALPLNRKNRPAFDRVKLNKVGLIRVQCILMG
jgi:hypothetical protein